MPALRVLARQPRPSACSTIASRWKIQRWPTRRPPSCGAIWRTRRGVQPIMTAAWFTSIGSDCAVTALRSFPPGEMPHFRLSSMRAMADRRPVGTNSPRRRRVRMASTAAARSQRNSSGVNISHRRSHCGAPRRARRALIRRHQRPCRPRAERWPQHGADSPGDPAEDPTRAQHRGGRHQSA